MNGLRTCRRRALVRSDLVTLGLAGCSCSFESGISADWRRPVLCAEEPRCSRDWFGCNRVAAGWRAELDVIGPGTTEELAEGIFHRATRLHWARSPLRRPPLSGDFWVYYTNPGRLYKSRTTKHNKSQKQEPPPAKRHRKGKTQKKKKKPYKHFRTTDTSSRPPGPAHRRRRS